MPNNVCITVTSFAINIHYLCAFVLQYAYLNMCNIILLWFLKSKLFRQVSTCTGRYQLPIFRCTNVHPVTREDTHARLFTPAVFDDVMSQNELTTVNINMTNIFSRDAWLVSLLKTVPNDNAYDHLTRSLELTR